MKLGDYVILKDSAQRGSIERVLSKNKVEVALENGFTLQVKVDQLEFSSPPVMENTPIKKHRISIPPPKIDLHIEVLYPNHEHLTNAEKIQMQLEEFENNLSAAIAAGMLEITFVHGIGAGRLREEIRKRLKTNKNIKTYMDAQYDRGATLVKIY